MPGLDFLCPRCLIHEAISADGQSLGLAHLRGQSGEVSSHQRTWKSCRTRYSLQRMFLIPNPGAWLSECLSSSPGVKLKHKFYFPYTDKNDQRDNTQNWTIRNHTQLLVRLCCVGVEPLGCLCLSIETLTAIVDVFGRPQWPTCTSLMKAKIPNLYCTMSNRSLRWNKNLLALWWQSRWGNGSMSGYTAQGLLI